MLRCKAESAKKKKKRIEVNQKYRQWAATEKGKKKSIFNIFAGQLRRKKKKKKTALQFEEKKHTHKRGYQHANNNKKKKTQRREKEKCNKKRKRVNTEISQSNVKKKRKKKGIIPRSVRETNLMRLYRLCLWSSLFWFCSSFQEAVSYF